jgi:hypothetical protein
MNGTRHIGVGTVSALLGVLAMAGPLGCSSTTALRGGSPSVAFSAPAPDVDRGCSLDGTPRVVATHVRPMVGVTAVADAGVVWLRFATTREARVAVAIDPETLQLVDAGEPPVETAAASIKGPVEVDLPGDERLVAWTQGSSEDSRVRAITVAPLGMAVGRTIDLGFEGSAIGRPAAAFGPHGKGVLAFIESNEVGFQVVVVRAACATKE